MTNTAPRKAALHRYVVDLSDIGHNVEDYKAHDLRTAVLVFDFGDKARRKAVVIQQTIIAVDRPVREVVPGSLDINNSIDVAFADFTNFDVQRFQEQSPRQSCGSQRALAVGCWA